MTSQNTGIDSPAPITNMAANTVDFGQLKECDWISETGTQIINLLESALRLSSATTSDEKAKHFNDEVAKLYSEQQSEQKPEDFAWSVWETLIDIAAQIPPNSQAQDVLVASIILLDQGPNEMFKGLPCFDWSLRDNWNRSPAVGEDDDDDDEDDTMFNNSQWLNLNSFLAKLHTKHNIGWWNYAIWELRSGLETELSPISGKPEPDTRVRVASEWAIQSASRLLNDSLCHACQDYPEGEDGKGYPFKAGPLFSGASGYSLERWCFWKRRFTEIKSEVSEELHTVIDDAMRAMTQAESNAGTLLANLAGQDKAINDESSNKKTEEKDETEQEESSLVALACADGPTCETSTGSPWAADCSNALNNIKKDIGDNANNGDCVVPNTNKSKCQTVKSSGSCKVDLCFVGGTGDGSVRADHIVDIGKKLLSESNCGRYAMEGDKVGTKVGGYYTIDNPKELFKDDAWCSAPGKAMKIQFSKT
ncbi:hypothetical protein F5Y04DRAFT_274207 [Hypomontagnella monticulosa]|nr:hypothetical protein F5Y04DRAFT_274207 [Hypomontagnella monticulosa]